ncbi:MAG: DUF3809 family protein [Trueperaceae bacterium]
MMLEHQVVFDFDVALPRDEALAFVRDVPRSLANATFLEALTVVPGEPEVVRAALPVNAAFLGQRSLPFESELVVTDAGARLIGRPLDPDGPGWAEVDGEAEVATHPGSGRSAPASRVRYQFDVRVHLRLPEPERWGGRALLHMIEFTARSVLERVTAQFPAAIQAAAVEAEAAIVA